MVLRLEEHISNSIVTLIIYQFSKSINKEMCNS